MSDQLSRIEAKLDRLIAGEASLLVSAKEARALLGCRSNPAFWRRCKEFGIKSIAYDKYRRADIENALARRALNLPPSS